MRHYKRISLLLVFFALGTYVYSQQDCLVLKASISGSYVGKCKKGKAHGKGKAVGIDTYEGSFRKGLPNGYGTYTSLSGEVYSGRWKKGLRHGEGKLEFTINEKDSLLIGIWENDKYIGPIPEKPEIIHVYSLDRYNFKRQGDGDRIYIDIYRNGSRNSDIEQFRVIGTSGIKTQDGHIVYYENVVFPFVCKINYKTWNKAHTSQFDVVFEFKITQKGNWKVTLYN